MENFTKKYISGLSILGAAIGENPDVSVMTFILLGKYDKELTFAFYGTRHGLAAENVPEEEILADAGAAGALENLKSWLRAILQNAINEESKAFEAQVRRDWQALISQQKEAQKPHIQGTVAEIAAKFGISKSEVRRLKADGKLDEFIQQHSKTD